MIAEQVRQLLSASSAGPYDDPLDGVLEFWRRSVDVLCEPSAVVAFVDIHGRRLFALIPDVDFVATQRRADAAGLLAYVLQRPIVSNVGYHGTNVPDLQPGDLVQPGAAIGREGMKAVTRVQMQTGQVSDPEFTMEYLDGDEDFTFYFDASAWPSMGGATELAQHVWMAHGQQGVPAVYLVEATGPVLVDVNTPSLAARKSLSPLRVIARVWSGPELPDA